MSTEKDFQDFLSSKKESPSKQASAKILNYVHSELRPSPKDVFLKLISIHAFIGLITLVFCPQYNLSFTNSYDIFHYFHHKFGENICMVICGIIFIGTGSIFAASILKYNEINLIRRSKLLYYTSLSILAASILILIGPTTYLDLSLFWLLGASLGGLSFFEIVSKLRSKLVCL